MIKNLFLLKQMNDEKTKKLPLLKKDKLDFDLNCASIQSKCYSRLIFGISSSSDRPIRASNNKDFRGIRAIAETATGNRR